MNVEKESSNNINNNILVFIKNKADVKFSFFTQQCDKKSTATNARALGRNQGVYDVI